MYFADFNATCVGERVFDIQINGQTLVTGVDVYALGGGDTSAVPVAVPAFYSSLRSSFDIALPTVVSLQMPLLRNCTCYWTPLTTTVYLPVLVIPSIVCNLIMNLPFPLWRANL